MSFSSKNYNADIKTGEETQSRNCETERQYLNAIKLRLIYGALVNRLGIYSVLVVPVLTGMLKQVIKYTVYIYIQLLWLKYIKKCSICIMFQYYV